MKTSQQGIEQIKTFEGFRSMPYQDVVGKWTVGYGHLMVQGDGCVVGSPITMGQATTLLTHDLFIAEHAIDSHNLDLNQHQFDALVSFIFNLGVGNFNSSTLLKKLQQKDYEGAANEIPKWDHAGGKENSAIWKRRMSEKKCFEEGLYIA
jgi:lysozyme